MILPMVSGTDIEKDLERLEEKLQESIQGGHPELARMSGHIIFSGGKRFRPALGLTVFKAMGGRSIESLIPVAVALELIHTATLIHDDIIDSSSLRRGAPSVHKMFGIEKAMVTGDFLFARAYGLCSRYGSRVIETASDACVRLAEGEIMQMNMTLEDITVKKYLEIITRKTADLFSAGTRVAAILADCPDTVIETMGYFGHHLGLAFQIVDDHLDLVGKEKTGKPAGVDVKEGKPTLPVIRARYQLKAKEAQELIGIYNKQERTAEDVERVLSLVNMTDGLDHTMAMARERADRAVAELEKIPENEYTCILSKLARFVVDREM
jgi:geranylgeranyl pyrophosphate synthase